MLEDKENIQFICKDCIDKQKQEWQETNKEKEIQEGDYVKIYRRDPGSEAGDSFWCYVTRIERPDVFQCIVSNDLVNVRSIKFFDCITVERSEIINLMKMNKDG